MSKVYPEKIDIFMAADALRQERGGKITILGAFAGGHVLISKDATFPFVMPIAFLIGFYNGEGSFDAKIRISDPSGKPVSPDLSIGRIEKTPEQSMQLMVNFGVFEFPVAGKYRVDAFLDDRMYTDYLTVSLSDQTIL